MSYTLNFKGIDGNFFVTSSSNLKVALAEAAALAETILYEKRRLGLKLSFQSVRVLEEDEGDGLRELYGVYAYIDGHVSVEDTYWKVEDLELSEEIAKLSRR